MFKILFLFMLVSIPSLMSGANVTPEFTVVFNSKKKAVQIRWEHNASNVRSYIIQSSSDNSTWKDIAIQGITEDHGARQFYFEDKNPAEGENYYRLKTVLVTNSTGYSRSIMVISTPAAKGGWVMYPVPVKDFLTLEYRGSDPIKGVINVFVHQGSGRVISRLRSSSLNRSMTIPTHNLGKGVYDVRIVVNGELAWNQRFVK